MLVTKLFLLLLTSIVWTKKPPKNPDISQNTVVPQKKKKKLFEILQSIFVSCSNIVNKPLLDTYII